MGDVVQVWYPTPDAVVMVISGPLPEDAMKILPDAVAQAMARPATWGKIFIADLSQASPMKEWDVEVLIDAQQVIRKSGGVLAVVDPYHRLPRPARDLEFFYSIEEAIKVYGENAVPFDVQIYLSDESAAEEVQFAVEALLEHFGVGHLQGERPEIGSWYRRLSAWITREGASEVGENVARTMNIQMIERHQADIDAASAQVVLTLMTALEKTPGAVIQAGSTILVKYDGNIISRQLTQDEMVFWKDNLGLFRNPKMARMVLRETKPESSDDDSLNIRRYLGTTSLLW